MLLKNCTCELNLRVCKFAKKIQNIQKNSYLCPDFSIYKMEEIDKYQNIQQSAKKVHFFCQFPKNP